MTKTSICLILRTGTVSANLNSGVTLTSNSRVIVAIEKKFEWCFTRKSFFKFLSKHHDEGHGDNKVD